MKTKLIAKRGKKIVKWGPGYVVFVTKEIRDLGWDDKTFVRVSVIEDDKKKKLLIEEMGRV